MVESSEPLDAILSAGRTGAATTMAPRKSLAERQKFRYLLGENAGGNQKFENVTPAIQND